MRPLEILLTLVNLAACLIPIARAKPNAALTRRERIRYFAELPLAPDAMLHNRDLGGRDIDASTLIVTAGARETACDVVFALGPDQRIASVFCADRAASTTPPFAPMRWRGQFFDDRQQRGRWIPSAARAGWEVDERDSPYWQGFIKDWSYFRPLISAP
jgi:hypothetical protein